MIRYKLHKILYAFTLIKIMISVHLLSGDYGETYEIKQKTKHILLSLALTLNYKTLWLMSGFPGSASGKGPVCQCRRHKRRGFNPWMGKIRWRRAWQPTPVFLPGEPHGQRSLVGYSP